MMAFIIPMSASLSKVMASVRIRRSDHDLMSGHRSSGKPSRSAVRRDGSWAARSCDHLEPALVGHRRRAARRCGTAGTPVVVLHGPRREPAADEPTLREVLGVVEGDGVRLLHGDVRPVGAAGGEHVAAPLDVDHVGVAGDDPVVVGVAVDGRLAAGPGEELVHPVEVDPPVGIEQVDRQARPSPSCPQRTDCHAAAPAATRPRRR